MTKAHLSMARAMASSWPTMAHLARKRRSEQGPQQGPPRPTRPKAHGLGLRPGRWALLGRRRKRRAPSFAPRVANQAAQRHGKQKLERLRHATNGVSRWRGRNRSPEGCVRWHVPGFPFRSGQRRAAYRDVAAHNGHGRCTHHNLGRRLLAVGLLLLRPTCHPRVRPQGAHQPAGTPTPSSGPHSG